MRARRPIPPRERCAAECGRRRLPGETLCRACYKRRHSSFAVPGRDVASVPSERVSVARSPEERHQDTEMEELGRCECCGVTYGGHALTCDYFAFLDLGNEYASTGGDEL